MRNHDMSPFLRQWIGFDKMANSMKTATESPCYPPYNIEKHDENHYRITLALAGFNQENLDIEQEGAKLTIIGTPVINKPEPMYLHQGIIKKEFELIFTLAEHISVEHAKFENGLLHIDLIRNVPKTLQPKRIIINAEIEKNIPELEGTAP